MIRALCCGICFTLLTAVATAQKPDTDGTLQRVLYNHPGLVVDLGVGLWAWPLPMDFDDDGDIDLLVSCPDTPSNGLYFFENPGAESPGKGALSEDAEWPVFKPAKRISDGEKNAQISYVDGVGRVLTPAKEWPGFKKSGFRKSKAIYDAISVHPNKVRANQWRYVDYDDDGNLDLVVGAEDWTDYGWDDAYDDTGVWTNGPLHGYVYLLRNAGDTKSSQYESPQKIRAAGKPINTYGMASPSFADFDGDGDLDLLCGEFLDAFTYFENVGSRTQPKYAAGRRVDAANKHRLHMDLQMITPVAFDWNRDGHMDLIVGDEDGRVAYIKHTGRMEEGVPVFESPRYFQQQADALKFGALSTPCSVDWDDDGDEDLICGSSAGYIAFIENADGGNPPRWNKPKYLQADGKRIRVQAGVNGSIQGPAEAKWGYTTVSVTDWDGDGLKDVLFNSIWGKVQWHRNIGSAGNPQLAAAAPIEVNWQGPAPKPAWTWWNPAPNELATQWRTTPLAYDATSDGLVDLVMLDAEGYLALFERVREGDQLALLPPRRIFLNEQGNPLQLNPGVAGKSGRRKLCMADWDRDGRVDLLANGFNVEFFRNVSQEPGEWRFATPEDVSTHRLAGHTTSPTTVDWDHNGAPDLVIGAEDGFFYYLKNPSDAANPDGR